MVLRIKRCLVHTHARSANDSQCHQAVLNKPPAVYAAWIMDDANWGGEIELAILSEHYKVRRGAGGGARGGGRS